MDAKTTSIVAYLTWVGWLIAFLAGDKSTSLSKRLTFDTCKRIKGWNLAYLLGFSLCLCF